MFRHCLSLVTVGISDMPYIVSFSWSLAFLSGYEFENSTQIAVFDCNLKVYSDHLRISELEHISEETGAELVQLRKGGKKEKKDK